MALQDLTIELSFDSITSDRTTGTLVDDTTFSSPARNTLDVFVSGSKMKADASIDSALTVTSNTGDPGTAASWTFNVPKDGWFRFLYVALAAYAGGTTYAHYDAVYDSSTDIVYRSLQSSNTGNALSNTSFWEVISNPADLALNEGESNESANIASTIYQLIVTANSEFAFASQIAIAGTEAGDAQRERNVQNYELIGVFVDSAYIHDDRAEYPQGEIICRRLQTICTELGLL